ncbi:restriction endonuclease subunit S [Vibrio cholerae]|uniref:restriction endonuclease subunit S n=1 Tax=Vibrio cholerae TaxID=666 RepID=UPI0016526006|nr:restriction endonuclease subunit S [Vibrio cholerae]
MTGRYKAYPKYMAADSKWLDEIPAHWKVTALKHVLSTPITDGPHSTPIFQDEGIPFVSAEAVSGGYINFDKIRGYISEEDDTLFSQKYRPQLHDVYMIKSGATTGISAIVETNRRFNIWSPLAVMRCKKSYNPYFLLNYLRSDSFQKSVQLSWTFGTQQNIGMNTLENLTVCFPPFEEQQKIANFLDHETAKIDTLIAKQEKLIELLKEKRQAVISHAVTKGLNPDAPMKDSGVEWLGEVPEHWAVLPTKRFFRLVAEPSPKNHDKELLSVYAAIGVAPRKELEQKENKASNTDGYWLVKKGDIIVNKLLAWMGAVGYSEYNGVTSPAYDILRKTKDINPKFYHYLFRQEFTQKEFKRWSRGIMEMRLRLYFEELGRIMMPMPPKNEQDAIVDEIESMDSKFSQVEEKSKLQIELLKERKTALISAAVTGKIDVRDWEPK